MDFTFLNYVLDTHGEDKVREIIKWHERMAENAPLPENIVYKFNLREFIKDKIYRVVLICLG